MRARRQLHGVVGLRGLGLHDVSLSDLDMERDLALFIRRLGQGQADVIDVGCAFQIGPGLPPGRHWTASR